MSRLLSILALLPGVFSTPSSWVQAARANPVAVLCVGLGVALATMINLGVPDGLTYIVTIGPMILGVGFFGAVAMEWGLRRAGWWPRGPRTFATAVVIGVAAIGLYSLPDHEAARAFPYLFWQVGAILMALYFALRPPLLDVPPDKGHLMGWYAGQRILVTAALTWLLATVLGGGVSIALVALEEVLGLPVSGEVYAEVWILSHLLVWPMAFLVGAEQVLPEDPRERQPVPERTPRWIAVGVGWALLPLALLYLGILYVYLIQLMLGIAIEWASVAAMNAAYLAFGVAVHMTALPLAKDGHRLAIFYRRVFPWSVPAPLAALIWALGQRLFEYGMTEPRALLTVVVLWLVLLLGRWVLQGPFAGPATPAGLLGALLVLAGYGPWGVSEVTLTSQERAVRGLLAEHGMITEEGFAVPADDPLPAEDQERLADLLYYFDERGANYRMAELFPEGQNTASARIEHLDLDRTAVAEWSLVSVSPDVSSDVLDISGQEALIPVFLHSTSGPVEAGDRAVRLDGLAVELAPPEGGEPDADAASAGRLRFDLTDLVAKALADGNEGSVVLPAARFTVDARTATEHGRLVVRTLTVRHAGDLETAELLSVDGFVMWGDED